jgi:hypothetical protein
MSDPQIDYAAFAELKKAYGYQLLENEWLHQISEIEKKRDLAASRGTESAWRYHAGKEAGFKLAMTTLDRALTRIEDELNKNEKSLVDKLLQETLPK